jgi:NADPH:quinone reductase-like Zn-dependent oxidoreductase
LRPQSVSNKTAIAKNVLDDIWPHVASGKIKSHVFKTYPLTGAREAHILMESSKHMGKIALKVFGD